MHLKFQATVKIHWLAIMMLLFLSHQEVMQSATILMKLYIDLQKGNVIDLTFPEDDANEDNVQTDLTCPPQKKPVSPPANSTQYLQDDGTQSSQDDEPNYDKTDDNTSKGYPFPVYRFSIKTEVVEAMAQDINEKKFF